MNDKKLDFDDLRDSLENYKANKSQYSNLQTDYTNNSASYKTNGCFSGQKTQVLTNFCVAEVTFGKVGCEILAAYNMLVRVGENADLCKMISEFEISGLHFSLTKGSMGSNPSKIINALFSYNVQNEGMNTLHPIPVRLDQEGILRKLDNAINNGKKVIFSGWWYHNGRIDVKYGIHTFLVEKDINSGKVLMYNEDCNKYEPIDTFISITDLFTSLEFQTVAEGIIV